MSFGSGTPNKLDLEECFQNGPPFQSQLLNNENYILTCEALLKALSRTSKQAVESVEVTSKACKAVGEAIEAVGKFEAQIGEDQTGIIVQFSERLKAIEHDRREMNKNIENFVNEPLENYLKSDLIYLKELKRKYEKDKLEFGYAYSRYMSKKPKDIGVSESAQEVATLRRELHDSSLSLAIHLNEMTDKKTNFVYQSISNYLSCRLEFAEKEVAKLKDIKGHMEILTKEKIVTPDEHKERLMSNFLKKNTIISMNSSAYNPLTSDKNNLTQSEPIRSGHLYKRSSHVLRPVWCRRFFCLKGDRLIYYSMEGKGDQARVSIDLRLCHVQAVDDPERRYCFDLISPIRGYRLQAENKNDLDGWLEAIKAGTILALQRNYTNLRGSTNEAKALSKEFGLIKETGHEDLIHSILSVNEIELSLSSAKKEEIIAVPGNNVCADCKSKDPDWASLSFGILICIKCSGIHRSLGVHLSKVRSLALDFWNPEHVDLMKHLGNERSWEIFEENYKDYEKNDDKDDYYVIRAESDSNQQIKEKWIFAKYVNRQFVNFPGEPNLSEEERFEAIRTLLWDSIEKDDVVECLRALALGALVDDTYEDNMNDLIKNENDNKENDKDKDKETNEQVIVQNTLQRAAQLKHWKLVALLLLWGGDAEAKDSLGRNLVHYIAAMKDPSISMLLSVLRKNPTLGGWEDLEGKSPLQYAEDAANGTVATIIRVFQAQIDESKGPRGSINGVLSGQESPDVNLEKTPNNNNNTSTTTNNNNTKTGLHISTAFERVLSFTNKSPFRRKKK